MFRNGLLTLIAVAGVTLPFGPPSQSKARIAGATDLALMLERSGYNYSKISKGIWEIAFKGKNLPEFQVRVVQANDIVLVMAKLADRKEVPQKGALFLKLLELNDKLDSIKFALSPEMLYARIELHTRLLDDQELKYLLEQISGAVDEAYPQIKPFLEAEK